MRYARNTQKKDNRLDIRILERDLTELQKRTVSEGLTYQTYVANIIYEFLSGKLYGSQN
jgi:predicted DNA binding CopG/RHH family protein